MKQRKSGPVFLLALLWSFLLCGTAFAVNSLSGAEGNYERVYDMADLFTDSEEKELSEAIGDLREKMKMDLAVVTALDTLGHTGQEFADQFYNDNEMGTGSDYSGALFLIDMDNREIVISTEGKMIRYMPDVRIETILDDVYEKVSGGSYFEGAKVFLKDAKICYDNGIASDQYNQSSETGKISPYRHLDWYKVLFALAAASVCGLAAVLAVVRDYGMKNKSSRISANFKLSYRNDSAFTLGSVLADVLIGSYVTQRIISSANNRKPGGGTGGGGSFGGGLSGGGRSTTHRSGGGSFGGSRGGGGHVHGGGSRKF